MRSIIRLAAITIMLAGASRAFAAPTTAPSAPGGAKPLPQDVQDPRPRVLVMPFDELSDTPKRDWVGKAMQQSLVAELTRTGTVSVITPPADAPEVKDAKALAKLARDLQAPLVITGTYQLLDQDLRVTGQMLESINGEPVAGIKADGNLRDLFSIEDQIGSQVRRDIQAIFNIQPAQPDDRNPRDPFNAKPNNIRQQQQRRQPESGTYAGSDLQRSLDNQWAPPAATYDDTYARGRYGYPPPYYYPPYGSYDYYDWCGFNDLGGVIGVVTVPRTPFNQQNNNYVTTPGQLGRTNQRIGNNHVQGPPGQLGRTGSSGGSNHVQSAPGQMGRTSTGSTGRTSTGSPGQMRGSR
jgi:TolB-like protein